MNHHRTGAQSPWRSQNGAVYGAWRRDWTRLAISPAPPAATRMSATPPRTSSGVGIDEGLSDETWPARPPPESRPGSLVVVVPPPASVFPSAPVSVVPPPEPESPDPPLDPPLCGGIGVLLPTGLCSVLLLGDRRLQRAQDVVVRARVGLHVRREMLERLAVAMHRVGLIDPAVVPVVQQELPARRCRLRGRGAYGRADERRGDNRGHDCRPSGAGSRGGGASTGGGRADEVTQAV